MFRVPTNDRNKIISPLTNSRRGYMSKDQKVFRNIIALNRNISTLTPCSTSLDSIRPQDYQKKIKTELKEERCRKEIQLPKIQKTKEQLRVLGGIVSSYTKKCQINSGNPKKKHHKEFLQFMRKRKVKPSIKIEKGTLCGWKFQSTKFEAFSEMF